MKMPKKILSAEIRSTNGAFWKNLQSSLEHAGSSDRFAAEMGRTEHKVCFGNSIATVGHPTHTDYSGLEITKQENVSVGVNGKNSDPQPQRNPIETTPVDISPYRKGNREVDFVWTFDSRRSGPHVMVVALTHGNEVCGAACLDHVLKSGLQPLVGKLTLAFFNVDAYARVTAAEPESWRCIDQDMNRLWSSHILEGDGQSIELQRARMLRPIVDEVDFLLDIHSMHDVAPPLMFSGPLDKGEILAKAVGVPPFIVRDEGHTSGTRLRDYGAFGNAQSPKNALAVECGYHWSSSSVDVAIDTTFHFLGVVGIVKENVVRENTRRRPQEQKVVRVTHPHTIRHQRFTWAANYVGMETIARAGTLIGWDGDDEVRTPYDNCVLILPNKRNDPAQSAVRFGCLVS